MPPTRCKECGESVIDTDDGTVTNTVIREDGAEDGVDVDTAVIMDEEDNDDDDEEEEEDDEEEDGEDIDATDAAAANTTLSFSLRGTMEKRSTAMATVIPCIEEIV